MSRVRHIELRCEIDEEGDAIRGEMSDRRGKSLPFSGWTEFATGLMSLAKDQSETDSTPTRSIDEK